MAEYHCVREMWGHYSKCGDNDIEGELSFVILGEFILLFLFFHYYRFLFFHFGAWPPWFDAINQVKYPK